MRRVQVLSFILVMGLMVSVSQLRPQITAKACSGGEPVSLGAMISEAKYIVRAQVQRIDSGNQNGIVRVEGYYKGGPGPEYMLVAQMDPGEMAVFARVPIIGQCDSDGIKLAPGQNVYLFVARDDLDGGYRLSERTAFGVTAVAFEPGQDMQSFYMDEDQQYVGMTEDQFAAYVVKNSGPLKTGKFSSTTLPRTAPLLITTAKGTKYMVPVDRVEPQRLTVEQVSRRVSGVYKEYGPSRYGLSLPDLTPNVSTCWQEGCTVVSANRMMLGERLANSKIRWAFPVLMGDQTLDGQAFALAPNEFRIAVWNPGKLTVYRIDDYELKTVAETNVSAESANPLHAVWSVDSHILAYSDAQGLWLWTLDAQWAYKKQEDAPKLVIPKNGDVVATPRAFSPRGNYLRVTEANQDFLITLATGERWPDGALSPDEQLLLTPTVLIGSPYQGMPAEMSDVPLPQICDLKKQRDKCDDPSDKASFRITQLAWTGAQEITYVACPAKSESGCMVYRADMTRLRESQTGSAFAVEALSGDLVVLKDKSTIVLGGIEYDLSKFLDGDIVSIQWLPSLLTPLEY